MTKRSDQQVALRRRPARIGWICRLTGATKVLQYPLDGNTRQSCKRSTSCLAAVILSYADEHIAASITDDKAKSLMDYAIAVDSAEVDLRKKYFRKLSRVIPPIEAARYIQMESKIRAIIRFDLAANVPLAE